MKTVLGGFIELFEDFCMDKSPKVFIKQLLGEVEHIMNYQKPRSVLSAEAEGWGR